MMQKKLDEYLGGLYDDHRIPGCGMKVRKNGKLVYDRCIGFADMEKQLKVSDDTIFFLASMTKLIVAVGVMILVEKGRISLNDNLVKYFPSYPDEKKRVRIRHLLNHSSSMGQGEASDGFCMSVFDPTESLAERMEKWGQMPFDCELGESAWYSHWVNFELLGRIIELASGMSCEAFLSKEIFEPLGMKNTSFYKPDEKTGAEVAAIYNCEDGKLVRLSDDQPIFTLMGSRENYTSGSGGLYGSLYDYDRFTTMLANGGELDSVRIISKEMLSLMRTPRQITDAQAYPGCSWGLGFMIFEQPEKSNIFVAPNTYGWSGAMGTHMFVNEETGLSATFMISMGDLNGAGSYISRDIEKIVFDL